MIEIALLRNTLLENKSFSERDKQLVLEIKKILENNTFPFIPQIIQGLSNSIDDVEMEDYESALLELQLIHNIPINEIEYKNWYRDWFYLHQLPDYLENNKNLMRIKRLLSTIGKALEGLDCLMR